MDIKLAWGNYYHKDYVLGYSLYGMHILVGFSQPVGSPTRQVLSLFAAGEWEESYVYSSTVLPSVLA